MDYNLPNILRFPSPSGKTELRAVLDENDDPWFIARDVCDVLGTDTSNLSKTLDEDERGTCTVRTPGGEQNLATISESGFYSLVLRSRKPVAKRFKKWVTSEVLPKIRKHGMYATPDTVELEAKMVKAEKVRMKIVGLVD